MYMEMVVFDERWRVKLTKAQAEIFWCGAIYAEERHSVQNEVFLNFTVYHIFGK